MSTLCGGTSTSNGIIPQNPLLGAGTQGVASVVGLVMVIMLTVLLVTAVIYMVGELGKLPSLKNFVKVELAEMVGTAILIAIFFGGFYAAAFVAFGGQQASASAVNATPNPTLHFNGPGRAVFVSDCTMVGNASIAMIPPIFASGIVNYGINLFQSVSITLKPGGFGFTVAPLTGLSFISSTMTKLQDLSAGFLVVLLGIVYLLGLIYALLPIFLYLGIALRAFPWTRAAGGIFIATFIGFYVVFPLMLNGALSGFSGATYQQTSGYYNSSAANSISTFVGAGSSTTPNAASIAAGLSVASSTGSFIKYFGSILYSMVGFPGGYGVLNGYINLFIGPPVVVIVEIGFCFLIALDFTDILADILGAPSLSSQKLLGNLL
jgi:hypothetical protein